MVVVLVLLLLVLLELSLLVRIMFSFVINLLVVLRYWVVIFRLHRRRHPNKVRHPSSMGS
jgi:hypothetical protein